MIAAAPWPDEDTMIPDLLRAAPQARSVLDRYGLRGCGGAQRPATASPRNWISENLNTP